MTSEVRMKTSALKILTAAVLTTAGSMCFAQQASDANAAGAMGTPQQADPTTGAPTPSGDPTLITPSTRAPLYVPAPPMRRNCAGLSDRQTERACREGLPVDHAPVPRSSGFGDRGGSTDDQAD